MRLIEILEARKQALRVSEVANLFSVTPQHIYKMAASGKLPSFRVAGAIRFDPQDLVNWLKRNGGQGREAGADESSGWLGVGVCFGVSENRFLRKICFNILRLFVPLGRSLASRR